MQAINTITCHVTPGLCQCQVIWNTKNTHKYNAMHTKLSSKNKTRQNKNQKWQCNWKKKITTLPPNQRKNRLQDSNTHIQMPKQPEPMYLQKLITEKKINHPGLHSSKTNFLLEVPSTKRHTFAKRSFSVYGPKLWNTLPHSAEESKTIDTFKGKLKTYLFIISKKETKKTPIHIKCLS